MNTPTSSKIQKLLLYRRHAERGAKLGHFGAWEVPLYYKGILEEHEAVRQKAGLFDISHMGKFFFSGEGTEDFLQELLPRDIKKMKPGQALYMPLLNDQGGFVDDIILYRFESQRFFMIVNAGNVDKDYDWIDARIPPSLDFQDKSRHKGLLAIQGPLAGGILEKTLSVDLSSVGYYHFIEHQKFILCRTGYTGEDGFEILADEKDLTYLWDRLLNTGQAEGLMPAGFGARDTLRLEAGMLLYGHDMDDSVSALEAGLDWAIDFEKGPFVGKDALLEEKQQGPKRRVIAFEMIDRGIPRQDYEIRKDGAVIGKVTSGTFSPTLKKNIGLGLVPAAEARPENEIEILVRENPLKAKIVKPPFYKRKK